MSQITYDQPRPVEPYTDFLRYLSAKKSVDDRALNQHVWQALHQQLHISRIKPEEPPQVVEIGAGIGTMVERVLTRGLLTHAHYTLVDAAGDNIAHARQRLSQWAMDIGFLVQNDKGNRSAIRISRPASESRSAVDLTIAFVEADGLVFADQPGHQGTADLLITHALLDLLDLPRSLIKFRTVLKPSGLLYATINFDGNTILQPEIERAYDDQIEAAYHATMDTRVTNGLPSGDSRTGRHLFEHLQNSGYTVLNAGASDWVVFGGPTGYPSDEAYFLHFIIETMHRALRNELALGQERFRQWIKERHEQVTHGELIYIAHQLDFLAQRREHGAA